jgi:hypothetical protein
MPRIRTIKPEFWSSPSMRNASPWARLLYVAMWNWADDSGRGTANVRELAAFAFPDDEDPIAPTVTELPSLLAEVQSRWSVVFYEANGRRYYAIPSWDEHQRNERKAKSKYPAPDEGKPYDPGPPDQREHGSTLDSGGTSVHDDGSTARRVGRSGTGTGEQGNRGTGETNSPNGSILFAVPEPASKTNGYPQPFEEAWQAYGRKGAKKTAHAEWRRAVKRAPVARIVSAIPAYVESTPDPKFRKDFERWLKGDCWESAVVPARRPAAGGYQPFANPTDPDAYDEELIP